MTRILLFFTAVVAFSGCVSSIGLVYPPEVKAKAFYDNGTAYLTQKKGGVTLRTGLPPDAFDGTGPCAMIVGVVNHTNKTFNFGPENITAVYRGHPMKVWTYHALQAHEISRANNLMLAQAIAGASQSLSASMPTTSYSSGYVMGNRGHYGTYSGSTTTYNSGSSSLANAAIQANTASNMRHIAQNRDANIAAYREGALRTTTLPPGRSVEGVVYFKLPSFFRKDKQALFTVKAGNETLTFPLIIDY